MSRPHNKQMDTLIFLLVEGGLDEKGAHVLEEWLSVDPENQKYYCDFVKDYAAMRMQVNAMISPEEGDKFSSDSFDRQAWQALSEMENVADEIEITREKQQPCELPSVSEIKTHPLNKTSLFTAIISIAALIAMIAFIKLYPEKGKEPTATLVDAMGAKWSSSHNLKVSDRLFTLDGPLNLRQGIIKIHFDNGADIVLEGPGELELTSKDQIDLQCGKLFASVPKQAIGFTINVASTRIIDLGTEFGIDAQKDGTAELHVIKGKTMLIAGTNSGKKSMEVSEGTAKRVSFLTKTISDIPCMKTLFVRNINSNTNLIWKGLIEINLADIVGGGDGFGNGQLSKGISLADGKMEMDYRGKGLRGTGDYILVPGSKFIDGVFVPGTGKKTVQISSQGHIFIECPKTSGFYTMLLNGGISKILNSINYPMILNGQVYGTVENPALQLRANSGITFDLKAIQDAVPGCRIQAFFSKVGISSNAEQVAKIERTENAGKNVDTLAAYTGKTVKADMFVLVDGQLKQTASLTCDPGTIVNIDIKLTSQDRFLTLVSTQGDNEWAYDWVLFAKPVIVLEQVE